MALEKFHYTFKDGQSVSVRRLDSMPFGFFRKITKTTAEEEQLELMLDAIYDSLDAKGKKVVDSQPTQEVLTGFVNAWANPDVKAPEEEADSGK